MNQQLDQLLADFHSEHTKLYGTNFLFEIDKSVTPYKAIVMTEKLAEKLRQHLGSQSDFQIVSLDKDESVGSYYRVKAPRVDIWHYYRDGAEWNRLMEDLDPSMVTFQDTPGGDKALASELIAGEVFRGIETETNPGYLAAAVCHDFENVAPKQLGWVKITDEIEKIPSRELTRPEKLVTWDEEVNKYSGVPYHLSGKSIERGMDCSGLTQRAYYEVRGLWLPRMSKWQALVGESSKNNPALGDLVIIEQSPNWTVEHIGILLNGGKILQASRYTNGVTAENIEEMDWFKKHFKTSDYRKV